MAQIQNISEIQPTLGFTGFDVLEKYSKSFKHVKEPFERRKVCFRIVCIDRHYIHPIVSHSFRKNNKF